MPSLQLTEGSLLQASEAQHRMSPLENGVSLGHSGLNKEKQKWNGPKDGKLKLIKRMKKLPSESDNIANMLRRNNKGTPNNG